jgi:pimeloyl-ACP methyl ester carboxylesterase
MMKSMKEGAGEEVEGRFAAVNGLKMYYEVHGTGMPPLVLLHGSLTTIGTSFGKVLPSFARDRQVIAIEQQAHGHTADIDRPFSFEQMADDTAELLRQLDIDNADLFGYSLGTGIAVQTAIRHPHLVRKLVLASPAYNNAGLYPEMLEGEERMRPEDLADTAWYKDYVRVAPDPGNWPALVAKEQQLTRGFKGVAAEDIRSIKAPTLIIIGDSDIVRPEHAVEMFRLLGGGVAGDLVGLPRSRLAVLPGTTHVTLVDRSEWLIPMITEFLEVPMPKVG